ncbi:MAG: peptidylprolyl isomerase [Nitrospinaceae bacterium]|mgnify:FL=1|nr:peptidylprolyl isomerase [Nitrospina sp.]MBT5375693.1 peptidylprolyl isomerase [Nitrospinaceae bacterium]MBT5868633.1 peptidylprolyl isomerase [Nitrospinaceae bacterium]MBT6346584.1 peptidylprolyl isomerase [Nitrospina sp.]
MIKKDSVVNMSYCLKNAAGEELDRADKNQPFAYLHGKGQIVPGLEKALEGLAIGDKKEVTVPPAEGYGDLMPSLRLKVERSNFPKDADIKPGMQFEAEDGERRIVFMVKGIEGDQIDVDGNHPLAGETLHFAVEITGIREATEEELTHGHAHGEGGAHHH